MKANHYKTGYSKVTGADVAGYLKRTFTTQENKQAEDIIKMFEAQLCSLCNRQFDYNQVYEEKFMLPAGKIFPHNFPVAEITSVKVSGQTRVLAEDDDYIIWDTYIEFTPALYGRGRLEIEYTIEQFWGEEVRHLILQLVSHTWLNSENGASVSEIGFSAVRQVFSLDKFDRDVKKLISTHRKRII